MMAYLSVIIGSAWHHDNPDDPDSSDGLTVKDVDPTEDTCWEQQQLDEFRCDETCYMTRNK